MLNKYQIVEKYLGIPYSHKSEDINVGLDCWTFLKAVSLDIGNDISFMYPSYNKDYKWEEIDCLEYHKRWDKVTHPNYGNVILFTGKTQHAGFCLDEFRFIHCNKNGVIVSRLENMKLNKKFLGYWRLKETINDNS